MLRLLPLIPMLFLAAAAEGREAEVRDATNVLAIQDEAEVPGQTRYDWGPSVMKDGDLYRMWWVRWGASSEGGHPCEAVLPDGETFRFEYPSRGDRIYYAESRDGKTWNVGGDDYAGDPADFGPDASGPLQVLGPAESDQERMHVACPSVLKVNGVFYLYYEASSAFKVSRGDDGQPRETGEYHNQIFVARSRDGKSWEKLPNNNNPQPIVEAPETNLRPDQQRYGVGQPSVFFQDGKFIMHYVHSCGPPGDFIVRIEADNPRFENARPYPFAFPPRHPDETIPAGAVARFAQTDVKFHDGNICLIRPAYSTGCLNVLTSRAGMFAEDAEAVHPKEVYPQVACPDPRGVEYQELLFPDFLTDPHGQVLLENERAVLFYSSGKCFKACAHTWDLRRAEVDAAVLNP